LKRYNGGLDKILDKYRWHRVRYNPESENKPDVRGRWRKKL